jgi:phage protein U
MTFSEAMMSIGKAQFRVPILSLASLSKTLPCRFAVNEPISGGPDYQYLGLGERMVTLEGACYPEDALPVPVGASPQALETLKKELAPAVLKAVLKASPSVGQANNPLALLEGYAVSGKPQTLLSGDGFNHGKVIIKEVTKRGDQFAGLGQLRKLEFTLQLALI